MQTLQADLEICALNGVLILRTNYYQLSTLFVTCLSSKLCEHFFLSSLLQLEKMGTIAAGHGYRGTCNGRGLGVCRLTRELLA